MDACLRDSLPQVCAPVCRPKYITRLILYSPKKLKVPNISSINGVRNIPIPGTILGKGEPLCSIITGSRTREDSLEKAKKIAKLIYDMVNVK
jgi:predicted ATP-grasp superfamily ATP-dependent carboligase